MVETRLCAIAGCGNEHKAKGYCKKHHKRLLRNGNTSISRAAPGDLIAFVENVAAKHAESDCLLWPFGAKAAGYGVLNVDGKKVSVTRHVCQLKHGAPPTAQHEAAHSCGNPRCCNPHHLRWATRAENEGDKREHGTVLAGERHPMVKITEDQVREIRAMAGILTQKEIGEIFGLTQSSVSMMIRRVTWKHI